MILAIDTSCDETAVAVTLGRKILSNEIYSQILIHKKWGGVVPHLAKRAHVERIDEVVRSAINKIGETKDVWAHIDYIAVTQGPGLAPALEVGINKAKELAREYGKRIIPVNHMEGHIYSCFAQNSRGNPSKDFQFPYLALLVSGGHTELVLFKNHIEYQLIGQTIDDAAGEALDKAAKLLGLGYPGGPVIERLSLKGNEKYHQFPRPMKGSKELNFSFSGLKTSFYYFVREMSEKDKLLNLENLAASFQSAVCESLLGKLEMAIKSTQVNNVLLAGGVSANATLRSQTRKLVKKYDGTVLFPAFKSLYGDNGAMIGIAGHYKAEKGQFVKDMEKFERIPRLQLV